jgi:hypothetical protein
LSVIQYELLDPASDIARFSGTIRPAPLTLLGPFAFSFATLGLNNGIPLATLPVGAVILDIGVSVTGAFNGTTPAADVGTFSSTAGLFSELGSTTVDLTGADIAVPDNDGLTAPDGHNWLSVAGAAASNTPIELYVTAISTLLLVVSQDGTQGGTATGATAGTGNVYVLAATPFTS